MMTNDDDNELNEFIQDDEVDERLLPDSDEDIIALMDDNEVMEEIIERLTKERDEWREDAEWERRVSDSLREERDAARREVCLWMNTDASGCVKNGSEETAIERGWDCFKE